MIVSSDGYVLTNNHVIDGADKLKVTLADNRNFTGKVIGADPKTDVAVVKIDAKDLPAITLADSDRLRVGDIVFAVGNPLSVGETVTMGIVSAKGRQTGAPRRRPRLRELHPDRRRHQSRQFRRAAPRREGPPDRDQHRPDRGARLAVPQRNIGIGFAIPANMAVSVLQSLIATGTVARGFLGVEPQSLTADVAETSSACPRTPAA